MHLPIMFADPGGKLGRDEPGSPAAPIPGIPGTRWIVLLTLAWVLFGLVGHDPWKADEAHTFGIVVDYLKTGDWVVPTLAGEPFVEKPPLTYVAAAAFADLLGGFLPTHDAARLATGMFVGIALLFIGLTARELFGRGFAAAAVLALLGCVGPLARLHQLITDVALFAGMSIGAYGLALARRSLWGAGLALGVGAACAFFGKGLLGPGLLAVTALLLPFFPAWRNRRYAATLCVAAPIALVPAVVWMHALYTRSPPLFNEWLISNNFGRFLGFSYLGPPPNPSGFYLLTLLWYAFPALPLAGFAAWSAWRRRDRIAIVPMQLPLLLAGTTLAVLGVARDSRELYLLPVMVPLSVLAAQGLAGLPAAAAKWLALGARWIFGTLGVLLWVAWLALMTGVPEVIYSQLLAYQPHFEPEWRATPLAFALAITIGAAAVLAIRRISPGLAMTQWASGITLCWALLMSLWLPYLDAGKSYRAMLHSIARQLPSEGCVASLYLGEGQRGLFVYFENVTTVRLEVVPEAQCTALLVQRWRSIGAAPPTNQWIPVWEGARPGDRHELYRLYRRDVAPGHPVTHFPAQ